jgi:serine/threonine protein kinase/tetratricopeptide (TPR) repeat protein
MIEPARDASDPLASPQVEAMVAAWKRGERPLAEAFLFDEIDDEAALRLIFEEFCLRQEAGMEVDPAEFAERFPRLWPELELLLDCQRLMEPFAAIPTALPEEGDELAGFRLVRELGRGVLGRVFLATETALAGRPVVVKVAPLGREEHLSLARLQHMNIVPLYSARELHDRSLQVLCMPFLGGASLAQVLEILNGVEPSKRLGSQIVDALDRVQASLPVGLEARGPFRRHLSRSSYVEAIALVGLCLAEGLRYAHERDFVHMDIKPSNVLIAGDGQPMLLDFHLAREPIEPGDPPPSQIGGTPGYMPPEQIRALGAVAEGRAIDTRVDGRADLFALALILDEALGGPVPEGPKRLPLHRRNPRVPVGLSAIVARCLEAEPSARYPDAATLSGDLRRFLDGLPLRGVANRSVVERWRNWRRRSPHAMIRMVIFAVAVVVACSALGLLRAGYLQRVRESAVRQELAEGLARSRKGAKAEELHRLAELVRFRYTIDPPPTEEARALIRRGEEIWRDRDLLVKPTDDSESDPTVRDDLLDFTLAWVNFRLRMAARDQTRSARLEAVRVLDEAEALFGPGPAIDRERRAWSGLTESPTHPSTPQSAREHFDLGESYLRSGETAKAAEQFKLGLSLRPQDFWLNFDQGLAAYRLGRFDEAVNAFRVAIALSPGSAECYYNRALASGALGRFEDAIVDYTKALELNPSLGVAALNRGILHYKEGRLAEASSDLQRALESSSGRADRAMIHYNLGLVEIAAGDRPAALVHLDQAAELGHEAARTLRGQIKAGALVKPD